MAGAGAAALRDDLYASHRALTTAVLVGSAAGATPEQLLDEWVTRSQAATDRCLQLISDLRAVGTYDLVTLSVALREIRGLTEVHEPLPVGRR